MFAIYLKQIRYYLDVLLLLANSALFGSGKDTTRNLEDALIRLGMQQVMDLVYALELPRTFRKSKAFDQVEFWKHSLAVAFISRSLAKKVFPIRMTGRQVFPQY